MKQPKVLLTGPFGFVGTRFRQLLSEKIEIIPFTGNMCDPEAVTLAVRESHCDVVVHLASKTHIDRCEDDRKNGRDGTVWKTNVDGTTSLAAACQRYKAYLLLLSTECVFDGQKGNYLETDRAHPINWYGETKWQSEQVMKESGAIGCILRSVLAYGHPVLFPHDPVVQMILALKKKEQVNAVVDQHINPTYIDDLVAALAIVVQKRPSGIWHYAGTGVYTPYDVALKIAKEFSFPSSLVLPVPIKEYCGVRALLRLKKATLNCKRIETALSVRLSDFESAISAIKKVYV